MAIQARKCVAAEDPDRISQRPAAGPTSSASRSKAATADDLHPADSTRLRCRDIFAPAAKQLKNLILLFGCAFSVSAGIFRQFMTDSTSQRKPLITRIGRWLAELVLVFVGAYAAFWLTNYQERQGEVRRHNQILKEIEQRVIKEIAEARDEVARHRKITAEFERALQAGEMPPVRPFNFASGYNPADTAALLQSGGFQLLDIKTIAALRKVEEVLRNGLGDINHFQKLSDEMIMPNLDQDISFFYDPATKQLRKRFAGYPKILEATDTFFDKYIEAETELLKQVQAERQRR
jgi:hypothetical protein